MDRSSLVVISWAVVSAAICVVSVHAESDTLYEVDDNVEKILRWRSSDEEAKKPLTDLIDSRNSPLEAYDANNTKDLKKITEWYKMVEEANVTDDKDATVRLRNEVCNDPKSTGCVSLKEAEKNNKTVDGLMKSECYAVTMYTGDFYQVYNTESFKGNWNQYKTYTYLLLSALRKLSNMDDYTVKIDEKLYRGLKTSHTKPKAKRIFWKTFTSTSLKEDEARKFGNATLLVFKPPATKFGARVAKLSIKPDQEEVLIPPFENFDVFSEQKVGQTVMVDFSSSRTQKLLN